MAVYKDKKCPKCAGTLLFNDNGYSVTCDSCGQTFTLSELNNNSKSEKIGYAKVREKSKEELESYKTILDTGKAWSLSPDELLNRIQVALKTKEYSKVYSFCNELQRRDPENVNVYLYKLLADLKVSKKENLGKLKETFENNDNYKLIMDLGDNSLKKEIRDYLSQINVNIENDKKEERYKKACKMIPSDDDDSEEDDDNYDDEYDNWIDKSFTKAANEFKALGNYKNSEEKYQYCLSKIQEQKDKKDVQEKERKQQQEQIELERKQIEKKDKIKSILKFVIPIVLITIVIISIVSSVKSKEAQYDVKYFSVSVTNKINDTVESDCYNYKFVIKISNSGKKNVRSLKGYMTIKNSSNSTLLQSDVSLTGALSSNNSLSWTVKTYLMKSNPNAIALWNSDYQELNIYFRISEIYFEDGKYKQFSDSKDIIVHSANSNYKEQKYMSALSLYNQGKYEEALAIFQSLSSYKNSANYISNCTSKIQEQKIEQRKNKIKNAKFGTVVEIGNYEQDGNVDNGNELIEWYVISKQNNKLLLLTKDILFSHNYDGTYYDGENIWATSDLRQYLNSTIYNSFFGTDEKNYIIQTSVVPTASEISAGGTTTTDKLFILSSDELNTYLPNYYDRSASYSRYETQYHWSSNAYYWTRSLGENYHTPAYMQFVDEFGYFDEKGASIEESYGVRIAMWIDINKI